MIEIKDLYIEVPSPSGDDKHSYGIYIEKPSETSVVIKGAIFAGAAKRHGWLQRILFRLYRRSL